MSERARSAGAEIKAWTVERPCDVILTGSVASRVCPKQTIKLLLVSESCICNVPLLLSETFRKLHLSKAITH